MMRQLLKQTYIPFGCQYYRAPSPHQDEWDSDLRQMAKLGFNMVKFWLQWRWNHPAQDIFYFADIDRLMELAHHHHLKVMLNTIFDVAPAWIYQQYPDASMVTLDGRRIGPQTQPHRQIGGLGYCLNHDEVMQHFDRFLQQALLRYLDHPALAIWNVGSEPELTSSMAEMRLYADNAEKMGDMLCYCAHCEKKFRQWLTAKYLDIERLNASWNRNYSGFAEVELPKTRNTFNDMIDWRMFFVHTLRENVKRRFDLAASIDAGRHPLMCHHVFIQGFPVTSTASDPWQFGQYGDLHGFTQMDDAMMIDVLRSCAKNKPVISAEMLMLPGYTLDLPRPIQANDLKRFVFSGVAGNQKGFLFWQYRPELLGREAPAWGLTFLDGSATPWLADYAKIGQVLQNNADFLLDAKPCLAEIALLYNPENQIFGWTASGNEKNVTDSLLGTHRALYEHNYRIDFIHPTEFSSDILNAYKVVYIPFPYVVNEALCRALEKWVKRGGVLIGESYFAGWNIEQGRHQAVVPGYGLDRLFQARQAVVAPAESPDGVLLKLDAELPYLSQNSLIRGLLVKETLAPQGARVLARFDTGEPAITAAEYGKGKAILIGSYIGLAYQRRKFPENAALIAGLVAMAAEIHRPVVCGRARVDLLHTQSGRSMMIVQNLQQQQVSVSIELPCRTGERLIEQFTGEVLNAKLLQDRTILQVALEPLGVKVYCD
jgi:beta-galactosidase